jgi:hypothetical protein
MKIFLLNPKHQFKNKIGFFFDNFYPKEKLNKEIFHFQTKKFFLENKNKNGGWGGRTLPMTIVCPPKKLLLRTAPKILSIFYKFLARILNK